ncbi:MAG: hypothetical protein JSV46_06145, partial [Candidatus Aminicenantes bacterium]
ARYYDQNIGRFLTTDPWEGDTFEPVTLHKYLYVKNNTVILVDPSGEISVVSLTASIGVFSTILAIRTPVYAKVVIFELYVGGKRRLCRFPATTMPEQSSSSWIRIKTFTSSKSMPVFRWNILSQS